MIDGGDPGFVEQGLAGRAVVDRDLDSQGRSVTVVECSDIPEAGAVGVGSLADRAADIGDSDR